MTIFISVVIALLLTAFVMFVQFQKRVKIQHDFIVEMVQNADHGIALSLTNPAQSWEEIALDQHIADYKSIDIQREYWGDVRKSSFYSKNKKWRISKSGVSWRCPT